LFLLYLTLLNLTGYIGISKKSLLKNPIYSMKSKEYTSSLSKFTRLSGQ